MPADQRVTRDEVLAVFEDRANPHEPMATSEVADSVDVARRTVYDKLEQLVAEGFLESKKVGARARVWWLATTADAPTSAATGASALELTSEHVRELEFASESVSRIASAAGDNDFYTEIDGIVPLDGGGQLEYWVVYGIDSNAYFEVLDTFPTVRDARLLSTTGEQFRLEIEVTEDSLMSIFAQFDGRLAYATIDADTLTMIGEFPMTADVSEVVAAGREVISDLRLVSQRLVYSSRLFRHLVEDELTDRQWTALQAAYYGGYFNWPRDSTGDELATRLGVTRQTFHHHLRHAEARLCQTLLEGVEHDGDAISNE
ncbi:bacterio-opsin activator domain-containing protein [Saliphagus sp. GCM10025334]